MHSHSILSLFSQSPLALFVTAALTDYFHPLSNCPSNFPVLFISKLRSSIPAVVYLIALSLYASKHLRKHDALLCYRNINPFIKHFPFTTESFSTPYMLSTFQRPWLFTNHIFYLKKKEKSFNLFEAFSCLTLLRWWSDPHNHVLPKIFVHLSFHHFWFP